MGFGTAPPPLPGAVNAQDVAATAADASFRPKDVFATVAEGSVRPKDVFATVAKGSVPDFVPK